MAKTSKAWMRRHVTDSYVKRARQEGYRSRAAYKLQEIDAKDHLLGPGMTVVDLGATPGGWSQVAVERVGARGRVLALDLLQMEPVRGVEFLQGDFRDAAVEARLSGLLGAGGADLVLSDMAPNMSGVAVTDQARIMELAELAMDFASLWLKPGGHFLVKVFQGEGFEGFLKQMRLRFRRVVVRKPGASRDSSSETYLLGTGPLPPRKAV
ncbi:MAG TPA: RlmE family RNA methyltransferase [Burkholderiales bacterium]|nr:RlmE family RNA methyltransferase [Burkholderiales bacterium]